MRENQRIGKSVKKEFRGERVEYSLIGNARKR